MRRLSTFPLIFLGIVVSLSGYSQRQKISLTCDTINFNKKSFEDSLEYYKVYFGKNHDVSKVDDQLALAYYVALRHYPELTKAKIKIRKKSINNTMQAQPLWYFPIRNKSNRTYAIIVNNDLKRTGMSYQDLNFNAQVGWLGHELAHILDYSKKTNKALTSFVFSYLFDKKELKRTERKADKTTIRHGLGAQLLDGVRFMHRSKKVKKQYKENKKDNYLSPEEIIGLINEQCE